MSNKIHASPTKDFFVNMITRDISLQDCICDLLDNSLDGARRSLGVSGDHAPFSHCEIRIDMGGDEFSVSDNCGGISLSDAVDYAFHFGKKKHDPADVEGGIGLYGIGLKRAIFKIGKKAEITSHHDDDSFRVDVDVNEWIADEDNWDFSYSDVGGGSSKGTAIKISDLIPEIAEFISSKSFQREMIKLIARDYSFFIEQGAGIYVNGEKAPSYLYKIKQSEDFAPYVDIYDDGDVSVKIVCGLVDEIPDDIQDEFRPEDVDRYGWFVICNDRVVLAADKSSKTVWGRDGYRVWHPQYNGFAGFAIFSAKNQRRLPWTTTKRDVDYSHSMYRRAIAKMKSATDEYVAYTNRRKSGIDEAKRYESSAGSVDIASYKASQKVLFPKISQSENRDESINISYKKKKSKVKLIKDYINSPSMSAKDVGSYTFDYFIKTEIGE